jgi:hypothetical protein
VELKTGWEGRQDSTNRLCCVGGTLFPIGVSRPCWGLAPLGSCNRTERGIAWTAIFAARSILVAGLSAGWGVFIHASVNCLNGQVEAMGQMVCLQVLELWTNRFMRKGDIRH